MKILVKTTAALLVIGAYSGGGGMMAQSGPAKNVVLVHGAFADDSSVASNDRMIDPEQEKGMAKDIKARTTVLPSSHVAMLSHPNEVAKVIEEMAAGRDK